MQIKGPSAVPAASGKEIAAARNEKQDAKLKAACAEMEALFLNLLLSEMRKTVPKGGLTGGGSQEEIVRSLLDSEMTKNMARAGGVGLAEMLYRQLSPAGAAGTNKGQAPR
jgi:flagellar protein FlgJ